MNQQTKLFSSLLVLLMLCFSQASFAQVPTITIDEACSSSPSERNYVINNTSTFTADLFVAAGIDFLPLQIAAGESYVYVSQATSLFVLNAADQSLLAQLDLPNANVCVAPISVDDACSTDPNSYSWVFINSSTEPANVYYSVAKQQSQRIVNINSNSDSVEVLPGDTVNITTDAAAGDMMCIFYENGLVDSVFNDAGACVLPVPTIAINNLCSFSATELRYEIANTSAFPADLFVAAGIDFLPLQIEAGESYVYTTSATSIYVLNATDQSLLAQADQPNSNICAPPISVDDACSDDPNSFSWVFINTSTEPANVYYSVAKQQSQRIVNINSNSDSVEVLPGDTVNITTDVAAGDLMCIFYENGLVDSVFNDAGACVLPVPTIAINNLCSFSATELRYEITNTSVFPADLFVAAGIDFLPLQIAAGETYTYITSATSIYVLNAADQSLLAQADQANPVVCEAPIVATDTCSTDTSYYSWVFYNNTTEAANVYYSVAKQQSQRVVNVTSNSDSLEILPGDTVIITTTVAAGDLMCIFYENGLVDSVLNDAGACVFPTPSIEITSVCAPDAANRRYVISNTSADIDGDLLIDFGSSTQALQLAVGESYTLETTVTSISILNAPNQEVLAQFSQPTANVCQPLLDVTETCGTDSTTLTWVLINSGNDPVPVYYYVNFEDPFGGNTRVIHTTASSDSIDVLPGDTVYVTVNTTAGEQINVQYENSLLQTVSHSGAVCPTPPSVEITSVCAPDPANRRYVITNTSSDIDGDLVIDFGGTTQALQLAANTSYTLETTVTAISVLHAFDQAVLAQASQPNADVCQPSLSVTETCSADSTTLTWVLVNNGSNSVPVYYYVNFEDPFGGNTRVIHTTASSDSIDVLPGDTVYVTVNTTAGEQINVQYENGLLQTVGNSNEICVTDPPVDPESCEEDQFTYTLNNAVSDAYHNGNHNHSIWLSGFNGGSTVTLTFDPDAYIVLKDDGTRAFITGNATMDNGSLAGSRWFVSAPFGEKAANTGFKKELAANAYDPADGGVDTDLWKMFLMEDGAYLRQLDGSGYIELTRRPSNGSLGLQVGVGANGKNINLGASSWFSYNYNGQGYKAGDFNLDMKAYCPPVQISVDPLCKETADHNRWKITNNSDRHFTIQYAVSGGEKQTLYIPKAGMASDADGNANAGNFTFLNTDATSGDELTVYYAFDQEIAVTANTQYCAIPDGTIGATNVCSPNKHKNRWRVSNSNDFPVTIVLAHNNQAIVLPAAGSGADVDGNANAGNYTFFFSDNSITDLTFTYGANQSITTSFFTGPCSANPNPESCENDKFTYTLSNAVSDTYHSGNHNHSIWLSGFNGGGAVRMTFDADAYLVYRDNGSKAYIHGNATMTQGSLAGSRWVVYVPFKRKADHTGVKKELKANAYDPADGAIDTDLWKVFLMKESAFMRQLDGDGYINMTRKPANGNLGLQIGVGANGKNINLGASSWFDYSYNGQSYRQGDFNLDLTPYCPPTEIEVEALCKVNPWKNRWRITNSSDRYFRIQYSINGGEKKTKFIPKAGLGSDADGISQSGNYTFINTRANDGNELTVYYLLDQKATVQADSMYCPVPDGSVDGENICSTKRNKNRWRVSNSNDYPVYITLAHNGQVVKLPKAGLGADADGNSQSGNYRFFWTHKSITDFAFTYGANQSLSVPFTTGPCSVTPDPESCDNGNWTHSLSNAVSDSYHGGNSNHSIALSGLGRLTFEDGAYLVYNSNGQRAYITGTATFHSGSLTGTSWNVYAPFGEKNDLTRAKKELRANAYDPNDGGVDIDTWAFFLMEDGAFMKEVDGDGYIQMTAMPADGRYGLQIGKGANGKNVSFGGSSWFSYSLNGGAWKQGDFNLNMSPDCEDVNPCSIYYIDNSKDKIYFTEPQTAVNRVKLKEYVSSPYGGAHIALNIDGTKLFVFQSSGDHNYGYFDTQTHIFKHVGQLNVPGGIVQAAFNPQGQLYFSSTSSDEIFVMTDPLNPGSQVSYGTITIQETGQTMNIAGADIAFDQDGSFYIGTHAHGAAIFTVSGMQNHLVAKQFGHACRGKITGMAVMSDSRTLIYSVKDASGMYVVNMDNPSYVRFLSFHGPVSRSGWGDMTSSCLDYVAPCDGYAVNVLNFNQGTQQDGDPVPANRSNANNALNAPQESDNLNFVSLGFRGYVELELASPVYNHNKNGVAVGNSNSIEDAYGDGISYADFIIVETSYGRMNTNCGPDQTGNYPELALVYGKEKLEDPWVLLTPGTVCRTSFIDIGPAVESGQLEYVKYVKILDCTDYARFGGNADGYDVDGLIICPDEVIGAITGEGRGSLVNARTDKKDFNFNLDFFNTTPNEADNFEAAEVVFNVYPNPSEGKITVASNLGYAQKASLTIYSVSGIEVYKGEVSGETKVSVDLSKYGTGVYIVKMSNETDTRTMRVVIK